MASSAYFREANSERFLKPGAHEASDGGQVIVGEDLQAYAEAARKIDLATESIRDDSGNADHYLDRGNAYLESGHYAQAVGDFNTAVELDQPRTSFFFGTIDNPNAGPACFNRGLAHYKMGEFSKAIVDFDQNMLVDGRDDPDLGTVYMLGLAYLAAGEPDEALEASSEPPL